MSPRKIRLLRWSPLLVFLIGVAVATACEGDRGPAGQDGMDLTPPLGPADDLPGVNAEITSVTGGTVPGGAFQPGNTITVHFTLKQDDGEPIALDTLDRGTFYVSGVADDHRHRGR